MDLVQTELEFTASNIQLNSLQSKVGYELHP